MKPKPSSPKPTERSEHDASRSRGERLRQGIEEALEALGQGFLEHPENQALRRALKRAELSASDYFNQLLRLVYRLIFLLTVEERGWLHRSGASEKAKLLYAKSHGVLRLAQRSLEQNANDRASDLWDTLRITLRGLESGDARLALPALAGIFAADQCPTFDRAPEAKLENRFLLRALQRLLWLDEDGVPAPVNWGTMRPEELGSAYETLLERVPTIEIRGRNFRLAANAPDEAHARRSSGSYYTPDSLVRTLLERTLEPLIQETIAKNPGAPAEALLGLTIVDPACGSGHFLLAAGRWLAAHVARITAKGEASPAEYRHALRQVVGRCLYGVDLNPLAVELCKVSLWLEAMEPGHPLSFLNAHIRCGNALLGATAERVGGGIVDAAWEADEADDAAIARALRKQNRREREKDSPRTLGQAVELRSIAANSAIAVESLEDSTLLEVRRKAGQWAAFLQSDALEHASLIANLWCSAFFWKLEAGAWVALAPTHRVLRTASSQSSSLAKPLLAEIARLAQCHRLFHWPLAFPQVFERGGFDVVLGNPPWIAHAGRAAQPLPSGTRRFFKAVYPSFAGYPSTHGMFIGLGASLLREGGALGFIIPSSVSELPKYAPTRKAHDDLCTFLRPLLDFGEGQFPGVTQPCMALVSRRQKGGRGADSAGSAWPMERPDLNEVARAVLARLADFPSLPADLFGERGFQSDLSLREHLREIPEPNGRFTLPLREGTDVREFRLLPPRVHADPEALKGKVRSDLEFRAVRVLVRNTARYPIAALSDGTAFRNSLLAGFASTEWPAEALVAYLNSALVRWQHYVRNRDARQPVLPQVKIGHLRTIPAPKLTSKAKSLLVELGSRLSGLNGSPHVSERDALDALVFDAFNLPVEGRDLILAWHRQFHDSTRKRASRRRL